MTHSKQNIRFIRTRVGRVFLEYLSVTTSAVLFSFDQITTVGMATPDCLEDIDDYESEVELSYAVQARRETASLVVVGKHPTTRSSSEHMAGSSPTACHIDSSATYLSTVGMHLVVIPSGFQQERHRRYLRLCTLRRRYYRLNAIYE
jgi:hypothetical protein